MRNLFRRVLILVLIIGTTIPTHVQASSVNVNGNRKKIIAVVLDDSTSMVRDDPGDEESFYTTRWAEADYAVRALAAMMEKNDVLMVYPLSGGTPITINIGENGITEQEYEKLSDGLDGMKYYGKTAFNTVETAADHLKLQNNADRYLLVITDGNFKGKDGNGEDGKGKNDLTQSELDKRFDAIVGKDILVKYIQIGKKENGIFPSNENISKYIDTKNGITRQITDVINEIYNRVAMTEDMKSELLFWDQEGNITINFNIPVKNVTLC